MKRIDSRFTTRAARRRATRIAKHRLARCPHTGLPRFRDRHQARDGARALAAASPADIVSAFSCPECRGWHLEQTAPPPIEPPSTRTQTDVFVATLHLRKRRYFLVDIENPTRGAKAGTDELSAFWSALKGQAPGIADHDHVVVGAARSVARRYRPVIRGTNVKWVIGADAPDAADQALLAAIDLRRVAREYDELVIVSGDGAFTNLALRAKAAGLSVQVVTAQQPSGRSTLSRSLARAADTRTVVRLQKRSQHVAAVRSMHSIASASFQTVQRPFAA